jgi:aromatic ring-opening dioxygenase catalytic subunit (LigB family)
MLTARVLLAPSISTLLMDQHRGHRTEMLEAYAAAARQLEAERPTAIVALTARWEAPGPFMADSGRRHSTLTDYHGFGVEVRYDCHGSPALARAIVDAARAAGVRAATTTRGVDSGVSVPLHFLASRRLYPVVPVSLARATAAGHRAWGAALRRALDAWPERVAFVVGGMLSHNVHAWNLKRETPEAQSFDGRVIEVLKAGAWDELERLESPARAKALPEANLMHLEVLRGLLGEDLAGTLLCYEPGPGVGAALVEFLVGEAAVLPATAEPVASPEAKRDRRLHVPVQFERRLFPRAVERRPYRPGARPEARTGAPRPSMRPGAPRPSARPGGPRPSMRPGAPRPSARPGGPRPSVRPGGPRPSMRPDGPRPNVRPGGPRPSARPGGPRPSVRPGGPRPSMRPDGPRPSVRPVGPRPSMRPGGPRPSVRPGGPRPSARPGGPRPSARPGGPRPSMRPGGPRPSVRPVGPRPSARPGGPRPSARPGGPRPSARPGGPRPSARPGGPRPSVRPVGPRPSMRPGGPRPSARSGGPRPSVRPGGPRPSMRPGGPRPSARSGGPRPSMRPGAPRPSARPGSRPGPRPGSGRGPRPRPR